MAKTHGNVEIMKMMQPMNGESESNNDARSEHDQQNRNRNFSESDEMKQFGSFINLGIGARRLSNANKSDSSESDSESTSSDHSFDGRNMNNAAGINIEIDAMESSLASIPSPEVDSNEPLDFM